MLADYKIADASGAFSGSISKNNKPGESRVGYAMAAAASGNLDLGVKAMKRAFALNSGEVSSLMFDEKLLPMVEDLTRDYEARMDAGGSKNDDAFMLAAMYQMQGDPEMASMAIDYMENVNSESGPANLASLIKTEMESIPMTHGTGWDQLAEGRSLEAIKSFYQDINSNSGSGVAKLGYGLAYAETGDFEHAAWAIRRAFKIDPEGVANIMLDGKLRPTLQKIAAKFENSDSMPLNQNNSLVLGTLYQLMGDIEVADFVVKEGKLDPSMYLVGMIKEENKMEKEMAEESIAKMDAMDETYPVFGPELPPNFDSLVSEEILVTGEDKMEKEMTETSIPKMEAKDETYPVLDPELSPDSEVSEEMGMMKDQNKTAEESIKVMDETYPVFGPQLPPDFDPVAIEESAVKTLPLDTAVKEEEPLVLVGPIDSIR